ncbi:hypothetical protein C791_8030 [Amycolatopsis azurea DSM 43854]|uniref:Uncharacterized protein n=1 Tax=Amycolatopsis azurea DSM 43854 TaxID=1238180 RepID=M2Q7I9_9PSEU|nr:hypothetical protein C791_8030 [Amycolatopsis azurea DSM 43854]
MPGAVRANNRRSLNREHFPHQLEHNSRVSPEPAGEREKDPPSRHGNYLSAAGHEVS